MSNSEISEKIAQLEKELADLKSQNGDRNTYSFSKISDEILETLFSVEEDIDEKKFEKWFNYKAELKAETTLFLDNLIQKHKHLIHKYNEEDLKINFLAPILNRIDFLMIDKKIRAFYEEKLTLQTDKFILNGTPDFFVSKGLFKPKQPFFFIQEFKKSEDFSNPRPQLIAEMITAIELNSWKTIKGAYIIGAIWNFVILEKVDENNYRYWISQNFDSSDLEKLKLIYKNLLFIKNEILEMELISKIPKS
jgi:hypothetical protein